MEETSNLNLVSTLKPVLLYSLLAYVTFKWIYRLFFHPLARFPGPKLAAATHLYEGYYDVVKKGRYIFEVGKMHEKYGPIVRIGPNEVHILDHEYYSTLYSQTNNKVDKYRYFYSMLGNPEATFPTIEAEVHRQRSGALKPFFSASAISKIEPLIGDVVNRLTDRMAACAEGGTAIPLFYAYRCMTVDIISEYAFGSQFGLIDREDWGESFYSAWRALWEMSGLIRQIPVIMNIFEAMPRWLLAIAQPSALEVIDMQNFTTEQTRTLLSTSPEVNETRRFPTVIWEVSRSESLPPKEKAFKRLAVDANSILAAGFETTGNLLTLVTYLVITHPEVHEKLKQELAVAIPDPNEIPPWRSLENLPYFSAIIRESLRLAIGATSRLPRVNSKECVQYKQWTIPAGYAIGMSALFISMSPEIFPNPEKFDPDRWSTPNSPERWRLEKHLHPFGGGSRVCIGSNLAYAEMYITIAMVFRRFENLVVWETSERDMEYVHDYFGGMTRHENGGFKVKVI